MNQALFKIAQGAWSRLPEGLRRHHAVLAMATALRRTLAGVPEPAPATAVAVTSEPESEAPGPVPLAAELAPQAAAAAPEPPAGPRTISSLAELDEMLAFLDRAAAISDDALREGFTRFQMQFPLELPADPDSAEYRAVQMRLYRWLAGKDYNAANEVSAFDVQAAVSRPFPYQTSSGQTVGNQLIAIGHLIRTMNPAPGARVLEFGPGWGNTTIALARMGCQVTAIDIEPNFVELINARAAAKRLTIDIRVGDFSLIDQVEGKFDAVLFFECFHHCADHHALVAGLDRVLAPGGKVLFAAEPITDDFPQPWGLRLDGESLWAIRKQGWLELGFQETYFRGLLDRHGWNVDKTVCTETPWGVVFVARRKQEA